LSTHDFVSGANDADKYFLYALRSLHNAAKSTGHLALELKIAYPAFATDGFSADRAINKNGFDAGNAL
jgi:hypothetical protein